MKRQLYYDPSGNPVDEFPDMMAPRHVGDTQVGPYRISTVFLGVDHNFGEGEPLIYETMVFNGGFSDVECTRYHSYWEAWGGHQATVERYIEKQRKGHRARRVQWHTTQQMEVPE